MHRSSTTARKKRTSCLVALAVLLAGVTIVVLVPHCVQVSVDLGQGEVAITTKSVLVASSPPPSDPPVLWCVSGELDRSFLGATLARTGDLDDDGCSDVLIGAVNEVGSLWPLRVASAEAPQACVHAVSGATGALLWSLGTASSDHLFGASLASVGDLDGDGVQDVLVSAPDQSLRRMIVPLLGASEVVAVSGRDGTILASFSMGRASTMSLAGSARATSPGEARWAVGLALGSGDGEVLVMRRLEQAPIRVIRGEGPGFGCSLALLGDLDGDGAGEILVGDPLHQSDGLSTGRVWVFSLLDGRVIRADAGDSREGDRELGTVVTAVGDVDGDGIEDYAFGSCKSAANRGRVVIASGSTGEEIRRLEGVVEGQYYGYSLAPLGDVNGDGVADIAIGSYRIGGASNRTPEGRVEIRLGGTWERWRTLLGVRCVRISCAEGKDLILTAEPRASVGGALRGTCEAMALD
jgi:hypothetical protein